MFWDVFKSVKLAVILLITLAIIAIIGTIIPQGEESIKFAMRLKPETFRIFSFLGLFDVYHTLWFTGILLLLVLNVIVCSIDRFPKTWKRLKATPPVDMKAAFQNVDKDNMITLNERVESAVKKIKVFLHRKRKLIRSKITDREAFFYFEEGRYSQFGIYMVHLSIIIILFGGVIGSIWGFEGYMKILEGEKSNIVRLRNKMRHLKLNFFVRCDKFLVEYYENGMPKEYISQLTFIIDNKKVKRELKVNHPVRFHGISFYQASYGKSIESKVRIKITNDTSGESFNVALRVGQSYKISDSGPVIKLVDIRKDFARAGPAILLSIKSQDRGETRLILLKDMDLAKKRLPKAMLNTSMFNPSFVKPYSFAIEEIPIKYYTGLQVSRDPGVPVVWTGFFMLIIGLMITFFTSHRRIWIRARKKSDDMVEIAVSGLSNRDPVGLSKRIKSILNSLKEEVALNV